MPEASATEFKDCLVLVDGSALAYRAHNAMLKSGLSSPSGVPTGAVFGFSSELQRLARRGPPKWAAVVFDRPEPTFRHHLFEQYKATRTPTPEELVRQLPWMRRASEALGFPVLDLAGYEADDIIGTLAKRAERAGHRVFIVTGDKDLMQLVSDRVLIYNCFKKGVDATILGTKEVVAKFGVLPERVADVLALMGDASDNIPGIPGIGEVGAKRLIAKYGSLEAVLDHPGTDLSPRQRESLKQHRDLGLLSRRLATIDLAVPIDTGIEALAYSGPRAAMAAELFTELGFRTLAAEMTALLPKPTASFDYRIVATEDELGALAARLAQAEIVSVDTETTSLDPRKARIVGLSFSMDEGEAFYVPLNADPRIVADPPGGFAGDGVLSRLKPFLEDRRPTKCGQNVKYDLLVLRNHGIDLRGVRTDTMLASYLLEPHERERNLDALSLRHFGFVKIKTEELIGKGKDQITMDLVPVADVGRYACEDADFTLRLAKLFLPRLEAEGLRRLHDDVEVPLLFVLADMEAAGVRVDRARLRAMAREMERDVTRLEEEIHALAGTRFNVNSPKQLGEVLFERMKIHEATGYRPKKTMTGFATGQEVLEELGDHPLPRKVLEYRSLSKLLTTYVAILPDLVDEADGRIHTSYNQAVAATGRLSSSDPNLQNIPIRTEAGRRIRAAFVPADDGHLLLSADYSQVELRILAALSGDPGLVDAFRRGEDIHRDTASRVFGVPAAEVDATMRSRAKAINFGILYGMGPQRLARETGLALDEAKGFIERYFAAFPSVSAFLERLKEEARTKGYVTTVLGRRRPIPDIRSENRALRAAAENMAVNTPIQGSAADILKVAMVRLHERLRREGLRARMILTVHDELVFDVPREEVEALRAVVIAEMEAASPLDVPLRVDVGVGTSWLDAH